MEGEVVLAARKQDAISPVCLSFCMSVIDLPRFTFSGRRTTVSLAILVVLLLMGLSWSQAAPAQPQSPSAPQSGTSAPQPNQLASPAQPPTPQNPAQPGTTQVPESGVTVDSQQSGNGQTEGAEQAEPETRITKAQAKELFRSVDQILQFASQDTGLPIEHKVKRNLITRESVEKYVDKRMKDDKDAKRLEQSRLVLQKFGLLPPGYDLHAEFLRLLGEQVAAYYDPKTQSVNLLDWVQPDTQKPILAHELTHALQDQKVGLDKWELAGAKDDAALPDQQEYSVEEAQAARQCVTEGQAMAVLFDYTLAPMGKDILTAPDVVQAMRATMSDSKDSPVFAQAPMFLKESLLMPYTFGLDFVQTVLANKGKQSAYAGMLQNPPIDTRQIMQPETYLLNQDVAALTIPGLDKLVTPGYERFDFGGMGEFDVYLLAKQYGAADLKKYYTHWRGGYYYAAHAKGTPKDQIAMMYFSRWDSPEAARDFAKLYADYLPKRYKKAALLQAASVNPGDAPSQYVFDTEEGKASLEVEGNDLLIMEGYDDSVRQKARDIYFYGMSLPANPAKAKKQ
jgi:hypothetical protein